MKLKDLTKEQQEHFKKVVEYCKGSGLEEQLGEATHLDKSTLYLSLTKFVDDVEYFYDTPNDFWSACEYNNGNLYQKPDKPWNFSQETEMKPEDLKCFKEVADVIGHEGAVKELQVVIGSNLNDLDPHKELWDSFIWSNTPQGFDLWDNIDKGVVPEPYKSSSNEQQEPDSSVISDNTLEETFVETQEEMLNRTTDEVIEIIKQETPVSSDMIAKPSHYQLLPEYEVKDVMKALLDKIEASNFDMSYYEAGWYQQSMQYFLRFHGKNGLEDLEKGLQTMQFVVDSLKERN